MKKLLFVVVVVGIAVMFSNYKPVNLPKETPPTSTAPQLAIEVTCRAVKKVDGKYRYFYGFKSPVKTEGTVALTLLGDDWTIYGKETYTGKVDELWRGNWIESSDSPRLVRKIQLKFGETTVFCSVPETVVE